MSNTMKIGTFAVAMLFVTGTAFAATVSFVKKVPAGSPGNYNYTYTYTCNSGVQGTLTVTTANDNQATTLAEMEAQDTCGEN